MKNFLIAYATAHNSFNLVNIEAQTGSEAVEVVKQWSEVLSAKLEVQ